MLLLIQIGGGVQHNLLVGTLLFGWQQVGQEDQGEDHHQHVGQGKTEHHHYQGEDEGEEVGGTEVCVPPEPELMPWKQWPFTSLTSTSRKRGKSEEEGKITGVKISVDVKSILAT